MRASRRLPGGPLSEHVHFLWTFEDYAAPHAQERVLPTGTMELVIDLAPTNPATGLVVGLRTEHFLLDTSQAFSVVGVHFKPGGTFAFFGPVGDLRDQVVPLDDLWKAFASTVRAQILEARTSESRFDVLERALLARLRHSAAPHPAVRFAVRALDSAAAPAVARVAEAVNMSSRRFIDLFRDQVGITPKAYARVRRFQAALKSLDAIEDVDWRAIALSCGYFDQAHFNHDFRAFSGTAPSTYLRDRTSRNHVAVRA